jgi:CubicO group peptidase (beta-lactamase class C family)
MVINEIINPIFKSLDDKFSSYITNKELPGIAFAVFQDNNLLHCQKFGYSNTETRNLLQFDSIFRIASLTKPITCVAALILYEERKLDLNDPLSKYLPQVKNIKVFDEQTNSIVPLDKEITVLDLFTHTSGFIYPDDPTHEVDKQYLQMYGENNNLIYKMNLKKFFEGLINIPLKFQPGKQFYYSVSTDILAYLIEVISGQSFSDFLQEKIFQKLGMIDTGFHIPEKKLERLADVHIKDATGILKKAEDDQQIRGKEKIAFHSGGGGLSSTLSDYLNFCKMLLNKGKFDQNQILQEKTVDLMISDQMTPRNLTSLNKESLEEEEMPENIKNALIAYREGTEYGLGVQVKKEDGLIPKGIYGWVGSFTTHFWIDPKNRIIGILFSQYDSLFEYPIFAEFTEMTYKALKL